MHPSDETLIGKQVGYMSPTDQSVKELALCACSVEEGSLLQPQLGSGGFLRRL